MLKWNTEVVSTSFVDSWLALLNKGPTPIPTMFGYSQIKLHMIRSTQLVFLQLHSVWPVQLQLSLVRIYFSAGFKQFIVFCIFWAIQGTFCQFSSFSNTAALVGDLAVYKIFVSSCMAGFIELGCCVFLFTKTKVKDIDLSWLVCNSNGFH